MSKKNFEKISLLVEKMNDWNRLNDENEYFKDKAQKSNNEYGKQYYLDLASKI